MAVLPSGAGTSKRTTGGGCGARLTHATAKAVAAIAAAAAHAPGEALTGTSAHRNHGRQAHARPALSDPLELRCHVLALCQRSSGSLARHRMTTRSSAGGVNGTSCSIGVGVLARIAAITVEADLPSKARRPVSISYSTQPNAKMSARPSTSPPSICSGAMYCGVPTTVWAPVRAAMVAHSAALPAPASRRGRRDRASPGRSRAA